MPASAPYDCETQLVHAGRDPSSHAGLEGGSHALVFPSGLAAITLSLMALFRPGDHALFSDSVYGPTRSFAQGVLRRMGVATGNERTCGALQQAAHDFGQTAGPGDLYLALRGLRSLSLRPVSRPALEVLLNHLQLFGIGLSWGGYESLCLPMDPPARAVRPWPHTGPLLRVHAGFESSVDLINDMLGALNKLQQAASAPAPHPDQPL